MRCATSTNWRDSPSPRYADGSMTDTSTFGVVTAALRDAGATFAFVFGSTIAGTDTPESDLDVAAW